LFDANTIAQASGNFAKESKTHSSENPLRVQSSSYLCQFVTHKQKTSLQS